MFYLTCYEKGLLTNKIKFAHNPLWDAEPLLRARLEDGKPFVTQHRHYTLLMPDNTAGFRSRWKHESPYAAKWYGRPHLDKFIEFIPDENWDGAPIEFKPIIQAYKDEVFFQLEDGQHPKLITAVELFATAQGYIYIASIRHRDHVFRSVALAMSNFKQIEKEAREIYLEPDGSKGIKQGFLDDYGIFWDRRAGAYLVDYINKQPMMPRRVVGSVLTSEDLY